METFFITIIFPLTIIIFFQLFWCIVYGAALLEHCLLEEGFAGNVKIGEGFNIQQGKYLDQSVQRASRIYPNLQLCVTDISCMIK